MNTQTHDQGYRIVDDVLACVDRGWPITPLCWPDEHGRCACPKRHTNPREIGKAPLLGKGYQEHLLSRDEVIRLWEQYHQANYGILLKHSLLLVVDEDSEEADREVDALGVPPSPRVRRADRTHRYFSNPEGVFGLAIRTGQSGKIDILSTGYIVGPGSLHREGMRYVWEVSPDAMPLEDAPRWAIARLRQGREYGDCEEIPADLPVIDVETLRISRMIKALIRCGPATDPARYPSRSEAVFAVLIALLGAGHDDITTLASIMMDPRYKISEKPREQGSKWLAGEIARAKAKYATDHAEGNGTGGAHARYQRYGADKHQQQELPLVTTTGTTSMKTRI